MVTVLLISTEMYEVPPRCLGERPDQSDAALPSRYLVVTSWTSGRPLAGSRVC